MGLVNPNPGGGGTVFPIWEVPPHRIEIYYLHRSFFEGFLPCARRGGCGTEYGAVMYGTLMAPLPDAREKPFKKRAVGLINHNPGGGTSQRRLFSPGPLYICPEGPKTEKLCMVLVLEPYMALEKTIKNVLWYFREPCMVLVPEPCMPLEKTIKKILWFF